MKARYATFVLLQISLSAFAGCGHPRSPAELEAGLNDPDPQVRRNSADGLRHGDDVPAEAIPKLLAAIDKEQDQEAYGAELITLGASGAAEARPYLCKNNVSGGDPRMSRWTSHALTAWLRKNPGSTGCMGVPAGAGTANPTSPPPAATSDTRSM